MKKKEGLEKSNVVEEGSFSDITQEIGRGGSIAFGGLLLGRFLQVLLHILIGRVLGPFHYGLYALGLSIMGVIRSIAGLGLNQGIVRFCSMYKGEGDFARLKGVFLSALTICLVSSILMATGLFLLSNTIAVQFFHNPKLVWILRIFSLALPFYVLMNITASFARAFKDIVRQQFIENIFHPLSNLIVVGFAFLIGLRLYGAVGGFLVSGILSAIIGLYIAKKLLPELCHSNFETKYEIKKLIFFGFPLIFVGLSYFLMINIDRIMLGFFTNAKEVGMYTAASVVAVQLLIIHNALITIFAPMVSDLFNRNLLSELNRLYKSVTRWDLLISLIGFIIISLFSHELLGLYGEQFVEASNVLILLLVAYVISTAAGPTGTLLQMIGRQYLELLNASILIVSNIFLNALLIPLYGMIGAAMATIFAFFLLNIIQLIEIFLILKIVPFSSAYFYQGLPLVALSAIANTLWIKKSFIFYKFVGVGVVLVITAAILFLTKTEEDKMILTVLNEWRFKKRVNRQDVDNPLCS
ncbi:MAG TPA: flippase [Candidatus Desulfofervidus auxilii]|uniref:Flippase n=1 Tax=Desulfofervidus auxilii TaxID=1621989 RepID=A0A7V0IAE7_DESA2|nr:flippase [Candidatus Desulfofervidus auxilii]